MRPGLLQRRPQEWGFATSIINQPATSKVAASVRKRMIEMLLQRQAVQMDKPWQAGA